MWRSTPQLVGFCSVSASIWRAEGVLVMFFLLGGVVLVVLFVLSVYHFPAGLVGRLRALSLSPGRART